MSKKDAKTLNDIGEALFGARWKTQVAKVLGVDEKQVRRFAAGEAAMSGDHRAKILELCTKRITRLENLSSRLAAA